MKWLIGLILIFLYFNSYNVYSKMEISANNTTALSYYYSLIADDKTCSLIKIESGWVYSNSWVVPVALPSNCDFTVKVWTDHDLKTIDHEEMIYGVNESEIETEQVMMLGSVNNVSTGNTTYSNGMIFNIYSMLPEAVDNTNGEDSLDELDRYAKHQYDGNGKLISGLTEFGVPDYENTILTSIMPKDTRDYLEDLFASNDALIPSMSAHRLKMAYNYEKDRYSNTLVWKGMGDYFTAAFWLSLSQELLEAFISLENLTDAWENIWYDVENYHSYTLSAEFESPDEVVTSNVGNNSIEPGVSNLLLYPGSSKVFNYDWRLTGPSMVSYPYPIAYWLNGYAILSVPVSGIYRFGSQSSGGVRAYIETAKGERQDILPFQSWLLRNPDVGALDVTHSGRCVVDYLFGMKKVKFAYNANAMVYVKINEHYYMDEFMNLIPSILYYEGGGLCSNDYETQWGEQIYLEAGQEYLLSLDAWSGWSAIDLILDVIGPDGIERGMPMSWIQPPNLNSFDSVLGWHGRLDKTELIETYSWSHTAVSVGGNLNSDSKAIMTLVEYDETANSDVAMVHVYHKNTSHWVQTATNHINFDGLKVASMKLVAGSEGGRAALLLINEEGLGRLFILSDLLTGLQVNEIALDGAVVDGVLAISDDGYDFNDNTARVALSTTEGVRVFNIGATNTITELSIVKVNINVSYGRNAMAFSPYYKDSLYVATTDNKVNKYEYDDETDIWTKTDFSETGQGIGAATSGYLLAILTNEDEISLFDVDFYGKETYNTSFMLPHPAPSGSQFVVDDDVILLSDKAQVYLFNRVNKDWSSIYPDWRILAVDDATPSDIWMTQYAHSGSRVAGGIFQHSTGEIELVSSSLYADSLVTKSVVPVSVVIDNQTDMTIESDMFWVAANTEVTLMLFEGESLLSSGFMNVNFLASDGNNQTGNQYTWQVKDGGKLTITNAGMDVVANVVCPSPTDISVALSYPKISLYDLTTSDDNEIKQEIHLTVYPTYLDSVDGTNVIVSKLIPLKTITDINDLYRNSTGKPDLADDGPLSFLNFYASSLGIEYKVYTSYQETGDTLYAYVKQGDPFCLLKGISFTRNGLIEEVSLRYEYPEASMMDMMNRNDLDLPFNTIYQNKLHADWHPSSNWDEKFITKAGRYIYELSGNSQNIAIGQFNIKNDQSYFTLPALFSIDANVSTNDGGMIYAFNDAQRDTVISADYFSFTLQDFRYSTFGIAYSGKDIKIKEGDTVTLTKVVSNLSNAVTTHPVMTVDSVYFEALLIK